MYKCSAAFSIITLLWWLNSIRPCAIPASSIEIECVLNRENKIINYLQQMLRSNCVSWQIYNIYVKDTFSHSIGMKMLRTKAKEKIYSKESGKKDKTKEG